ncbi:unnamed protein product, partial [Ectocarpus sp. 12 AP-2014]
GVDRPSTSDVLSWGLKGESAASLGVLVRWIKSRVLAHERKAEALTSDDGNEELTPPFEREALVAECKDLQRQIRTLHPA